MYIHSICIHTLYIHISKPLSSCFNRFLSSRQFTNLNTQCVAVCCVCCSALHRVASFCSVLQCPSTIFESEYTTCCSVLQCTATCCSVFLCVAVYCNVLQCVLVCCRVLQRVAVSPDNLPIQTHEVVHCVAVCYYVLYCVAVRHRVLQCVAVCCSVLQCVAVCCSVS